MGFFFTYYQRKNKNLEKDYFKKKIQWPVENNKRFNDKVKVIMLLIKSYYNRVDISSKSKNKETGKLIKDLKNSFPRVFLEGLRKCVKTKVKFELKVNVKPVFKPNRKLPFVALESVNKELKRLGKLGVISKINFSNWASPSVFVKKKFLNSILCRFFNWFKRSFLSSTVIRRYICQNE